MRRRRQALEFVTHHPKAVEMYPPVPALAAAPDWYRAQPRFVSDRKFPGLRLRADVTLKGCPGVGDYLDLGYVVPLWADYVMVAAVDGFRWEAAVVPDVGAFAPEQWEHFPRREGTHDWVLKISTPWHLRTPRGWSVLVMQPWYQQNVTWTVFPGVVDTDRCPVLNLIAMWHAPVDEPVLMKAGTPLLHVVPFRRDRLALDVRADGEAFDDMVGRSIGAVAGQRLVAGCYREDRERSR